MRKQWSVVHGKLLLELHLVQIILNTIIITSIILLSANYILPLVADSKFGNAIAALITSSYFSFMHYHCDALLLNR
jgi:hypothetical protein